MAVSLNTFTANTTIESAKVNENFQNLSDRIRPSFVFTADEYLTTGTKKTPILIAPLDLTIEKAWAIVKTAPQGQSLIVDINLNGTSIWASNQGNRLTMPAASTSDTQTAFDTTSISEGDQLTLDVDQVGSSTPGESLTVVLKCS